MFGCFSIDRQLQSSLLHTLGSSLHNKETSMDAVYKLKLHSPSQSSIAHKLLTRPWPKFRFLPICFSVLLKFSIHFASYYTHFAFYHTHFAF